MAKRKLKTNRSAAKRFSITGTGRFKRKKAGMRHFMRRKKQSTKRNLRNRGYVDKTNQKFVEKLLPYASNWQIKEHVWYGTKKVDIDLPRLRAIIDKVGYRGFTPVEALGPGDPEEVVTAFLNKVRKAFA